MLIFCQWSGSGCFTFETHDISSCVRAHYVEPRTDTVLRHDGHMFNGVGHLELNLLHHSALKNFARRLVGGQPLSGGGTGTYRCCINIVSAGVQTARRIRESSP